MYHADLIGGLSVFLLGRKIPVIWGIHNTNLGWGSIKLSTQLVGKVCAKLSYILPTRIIYVADESRIVHQRFGYSLKKGSDVIPNGFDGSIFKPDAKAKNRIREELHLSSNTHLVGLIARFDPQKDHKNFIKAASLLLQSMPEVKFLL